MKRAQFIRAIKMDWKNEQNRNKRMRNEMYSNVQCFVKGDIVYALAPSPTDIHTGMHKFRMDFIGPLAVVEVLDDTHYKLKLLSQLQDILPEIWHINRLKKGAEGVA